MKNIILKVFVLCVVFGLSFSVVEANVFTDIGNFFGNLITGHAVTKEPVCGNRIKETGEVCDGTDFGGITCSSFGYESGNLYCSADCRSIITRNCLSVGGTQPSESAPATTTLEPDSGSSTITSVSSESSGGGDQQQMGLPPDQGGSVGGGGGGGSSACTTCNGDNLVVNGVGNLNVNGKVGIGTWDDELTEKLNIKNGGIYLYDPTFDGKPIKLQTQYCRYGYFDMYYDRLRYITNDADPSDNTESAKFFIENDGTVAVKKIRSNNNDGDVIIKLGYNNEDWLPSNAQESGQTGCNYEGYTGQPGQGGGAG